ncbi:MAG: hypothetical protein HOC20_06905 [Chloroflexi bacterium]|jgi:hypothetical protein|nr:hypothetical protein [Chloroflexota bacterium]
MAKYILLWELDTTRTPDDPKVRQQQWRTLQDMVVKQLETGELKDWGLYIGGNKGYAIIEGTDMDVLKLTTTYIPYVSFDVKQVASVEQVIENTKAMG